MKIIPAIDIQNGKCVRLMQGDFDKSTVYENDPYSVALKWRIMGARAVQLIDLDAARYGKLVNQEIVRKIASIPELEIQYGGGIRSRDDIELLLGWGVAKAILSTSAFEKGDEVVEWVRAYGDRILISFDTKNGSVMKQGWQSDVGIPLDDCIKRMRRLGVDECIYTDIVRDGTLGSINETEIRRLIEVSGLRVIVAGGVRTLGDVKKLKKIGASGVIIGRALYEKTLDLKEVLGIC